ncbi:MAG: hypothetical protein ACREXS_21415 [Gammaproteobacteria bacterium]
MTKLIVLFVLALLVPLVFLIACHRRMPLWLFVITIVYFPLIGLIAYPVGLFAHTLTTITRALPDDCKAVISAINRYQSWRISKFYDQPIIEVSFRLNPDIQTQALIALCEYNLGNSAAAKQAIDQLSGIDEKELGRHIDAEKYKTLRRNIERTLKATHLGRAENVPQ